MSVSRVAKTICVTRPSSNVTMINVFQRNTPVITKMIVATGLTNLHKSAKQHTMLRHAKRKNISARAMVPV